MFILDRKQVERAHLLRLIDRRLVEYKKEASFEERMTALIAKFRQHRDAAR